MARLTVIFLAGVLLLAAGASAATRHATLRLDTLKPLVVEGRGFAPHVRVTITVQAGTTRLLRHVLPTPTGRIVASFGVISIDRCSGLFAKAVQRSIIATVRLPQPACAPATTP